MRMGLVQAGSSLLHAGPALVRRIDGRRHRHRALDRLPDVLRVVALEMGSTEPAGWVVHRAITSSTLVAVVTLGPPGSDPVAVLKMPSTPDGAASQQREARALSALAAVPSVGEFGQLVPFRLAGGQVGGQPYTVERALPGIASEVATADPSARRRAAVGAATAIGRLHQRTARTTVVDTPLLDSWVDERLRVVAAATRQRDALQRLGTRLRSAWGGRSVTIGWVHGDFWSGNVLVDPASGTTTGIVDWEWSGADELAHQDIVYACIHDRMQVQRRQLGDVVVDLLAGAEWDGHEQALAQAAGGPEAVMSRVDVDVLLLVWLRQIAYNLIQGPSMARNFIWVRHNVDNVLRAI